MTFAVLLNLVFAALAICLALLVAAVEDAALEHDESDHRGLSGRDATPGIPHSKRTR